MKKIGKAILTVSFVLIFAASVQVAAQTPAPATSRTAAAPVSGATSAPNATPAPAPTPAQPAAGENLHQLNFVVDLLALLTTILALFSGYTVYRSHHEAGEAKRVASATLTEAQSALKEARSTLETCADIKAKLKTAHDEILDELTRKKASFEEELKRGNASFEQELKNDKAAFTRRMEAELESFRNQLHEATTINRTKARLMELLSGEAPNPDEVFPLLTDILNYPDQRSIEIYERLLEVFSGDGEIVSKVRLGLQMFRERHYVSSRKEVGS